MQGMWEWEKLGYVKTLDLRNWNGGALKECEGGYFAHVKLNKLIEFSRLDVEKAKLRRETWAKDITVGVISIYTV